MHNIKGWLLFLGLLLWSSVHAEALSEKLGEDEAQDQRWNQFVEDVHALHLRQLQGREIAEHSKIGGYATDKDFYIQVEYIDKSTGWLLSRIRWEREQPENMHAIEVFIYDNKGRVIRDYGATYLPHYRHAPLQTIIALHNYNYDLHAFRVFDASAVLTYEQCQGDYKSKPVKIRLDEDDLAIARSQTSGVMQSEEYQACFANLTQDVTPYLRAEMPQS